MKITPLAADSMGTRSSSVLVETNDCRICIDPAVSLAPKRFNLAPHPIEFTEMDKQWDNIQKAAKSSDVIAVTHYHYDHHNPNMPELYQGKTVLLKHPTQNINKSQKGRAEEFLAKIQHLPKKVEYADGNSYQFGKTQICCSPAVPHGADSKLGCVFEIFIQEGNETFLFTSDVEGPNTVEQLSFILEKSPNIVYLDGPMTYMLGFRYTREQLEKAISNMQKILSLPSLKTLIVDHHLLRDAKWDQHIAPVFQSGKKIVTAAQYLGQPNSLLESQRKQLYQEHPVDENIPSREIEE